MSHGAFSFPIYVPVMGTHDTDLKEVVLISRKWSLHSQGETDCATVIRRHGKDWDERNMSGDLPPFRPRAGFPEWDWIFPGRGLKAGRVWGGFGEAGPAHGAPGQERTLRWEQGWAACRGKDKLVSWLQGPWLATGLCSEGSRAFGIWVCFLYNDHCSMWCHLYVESKKYSGLVNVT